MSNIVPTSPAPTVGSKIVPVDGGEKAVIVTTAKGTETFRLDQAPSADSLLVQERLAVIRESIGLKPVVDNLQNAGKLTAIAYHGLASEPELQNEVSALQVNIYRLSDAAAGTLLTFESESDNICGVVSQALSSLFSAEEAKALELLKKCATYAENMAAASTDLATRFDNEADKAQGIYQKAITRRGVEVEKRKSLTTKLNTVLNAVQSKRTSLKSIDEDIKEAETLYAESKSAEERESTRAFVLQMTGVVIKGLSAGLNMALAFKNPLRAMMTAPAGDDEGESGGEEAGLTSQIKKKKEEVAALKKAAEEATAKKDKVKKDKEAADKNLVEKEAELEIAEEPDEKTELTSEVAKLKAKKKKLEKDLADAEKADKEQAAKLKAVTEALNGLADQANKVAESRMSEAARHAKEKLGHLQQKQKLREDKRKTQEAIDGMVGELYRAAIDDRQALAVAASLTLSAAALRQVQSALLDAAAFWRAMARVVKGLSATGFIDVIQAELKTLDSADQTKTTKELRITLYRQGDLMAGAAGILANWRALGLICRVSALDAIKAREEINQDIQVVTSSGAAMEYAKRLSAGFMGKSKELAAAIEAERQKAEAEERELTKQLKEQGVVLIAPAVSTPALSK
jgi:hypothetical protein